MKNTATLITYRLPYGRLLNRKVTVFAQNAELANAILDDWRGGQQLKESR